MAGPLWDTANAARALGFRCRGGGQSGCPLAADLTAVFCCGETPQERESGRAEDVVLQQLQAGVLRIPVDQIGNVIVAYEPVWAIGTGVTATSEQAQDMHACIRGWLTEAFGTEVAESIPCLRRLLQTEHAADCFPTGHQRRSH